MELTFPMIASEVPLLDALTHTELDIVEPYFIHRYFEASATLFKEGGHGQSVCFVIEGELDVYKADQQGKSVHLAVLKKGDSVGEMSIIDGRTRSATIRSRTIGSLIILKRSNFDELVDGHPEIGIKILKGLSRILSEKLRKTSDTFSKLVSE